MLEQLQCIVADCPRSTNVLKCSSMICSDHFNQLPVFVQATLREFYRGGSHEMELLRAYFVYLREHFTVNRKRHNRNVQYLRAYAYRLNLSRRVREAKERSRFENTQ